MAAGERLSLLDHRLGPARSPLCARIEKSRATK